MTAETSVDGTLPDTVNPPGQPALHRGVGAHSRALARMRDRLAAGRAGYGDLADDGDDLALRAMARLGTDDPSIALLDAWALVTDTVSFYNERIANEGFLRTATQLRSVRELSRMLGYELRPGVAAQADLVFTVESAPGAPQVVTVPAATPVQSVPGPGQLPQTFETGAELEARAAWNAIPAVDARPQVWGAATSRIWLRGTGTWVRPGDAILVSGESATGAGGSPVIAHVETVDPSADFPGWTSLSLDQSLDPLLDLTGEASVLAFRERLRPFGWNAPDPNRLVVDNKAPPGAAEAGDLDPPLYYWKDYEVTNPLVIDGDRPEIRPGSWLVLEGEGDPQAAAVVAVAPGGDALFAISGPFTTVTVDALVPLVVVDARRRVVVHAVSEVLPTAEEPDDNPIAERTVVVGSTDPPLPAGRSVVIEGSIAATGETAAAPAIVASAVDAGDGTVTLTLDRDVPTFSRQGLIVRANIVAASHGESVQQVLGSADGRAAFATFRPRRGPLTHVRATTPAGARPELTVRVDGMAWAEVPDLAGAGPQDRVYALRHDENGAVRVVLGDGAHGARAPSGTENITAGYRVGIGEPGAVGAGALSILVRRPLGIRAVTNPMPAADWAAAETMAEARTNAPLRVRTLDRVVSLLDHEDLAPGTPALGPRAPTWCGTARWIACWSRCWPRRRGCRARRCWPTCPRRSTRCGTRPGRCLSSRARSCPSGSRSASPTTPPPNGTSSSRRWRRRCAPRSGPRCGGSPTRSPRPQCWWSFAACPVWLHARCRCSIGFRPTPRSSGDAAWPVCSSRRPRPLRRLPRCRVTSSPPNPAGGTAARGRRSCSPSPTTASRSGR